MEKFHAESFSGEVSNRTKTLTGGGMDAEERKKKKHQWTEKGFFSFFGINVRESSEAKVPYLITKKQIVILGEDRAFNYEYDDHGKLIITEAL